MRAQIAERRRLYDTQRTTIKRLNALERKIDILLEAKGPSLEALNLRAKTARLTIKVKDQASQTEEVKLEALAEQDSLLSVPSSPRRTEIKLKKPHSPKSVAQIVQLFSQQTSLADDNQQSWALYQQIN